jgi:hypothetical protein
VDAFGYSIFKPISPREIIEQHRTTPYFEAELADTITTLRKEAVGF